MDKFQHPIDTYHSINMGCGLVGWHIRQTITTKANYPLHFILAVLTCLRGLSSGGLAKSGRDTLLPVSPLLRWRLDTGAVGGGLSTKSGIIGAELDLFIISPEVFCSVVYTGVIIQICGRPRNEVGCEISWHFSGSSSALPARLRRMGTPSEQIILLFSSCT